MTCPHYLFYKSENRRHLPDKKKSPTANICSSEINHCQSPLSLYSGQFNLKMQATIKELQIFSKFFEIWPAFSREKGYFFVK